MLSAARTYHRITYRTVRFHPTSCFYAGELALLCVIYVSDHYEPSVANVNKKTSDYFQFPLVVVNISKASG